MMKDEGYRMDYGEEKEKKGRGEKMSEPDYYYFITRD
jgi:hypothetical protein